MSDALPTIYALIWRSNETDDELDPEAYQARVPQLMQWLGELKARDLLVACGGGGFANHQGGLTIVRTDTVEEALELAQASPMNEIGSTELLAWSTYFADLSVPRDM